MLKLPKLPDRTPVRIILNVSPALHGDLAAYAGAYRQAYGSAESVAELIPFMLEAFLASDRDFAKLRKEGVAVPVPEPRRGRKPRASTVPVIPTTSPEPQS
ncbi:MAG: DUF2274 domain-containing protein [Magnetospirillum sp.]|nr:DUF2274 domain-containing protein [Magnetospirillum sp.]